MSRLRSRALSGLVLALVLSAGACSSGGDEDGSTSPPTTETTSASTTTAPDEPGDTVTSTDADLELPRSVIYAGVELEVTGATWSNALPSSFGRDEPVLGEAELLFLELRTAFVDGFPGDDGFMPVRHFVIETDGGERLEATGVDDLAEVPVKASADGSAVLAFELDPDDLDGAKLVYADGEHVPATLPLEGEVPTSPYPIRTEIGEAAEPVLFTACDPAQADVELVAVEWDVDGGVGVDGAKLARGRSSRAQVEHRWLRAEVVVTARTVPCGGTFANQETFRVEADGETIEPANVYSLTLEGGDTEPMTFLFEVPAEAAEVALDAGALGEQTATFELEVPELP